MWASKCKNCTKNSNPKGIPPTLYYNILHIGLFQRSGIVCTHGTMPYVGIGTLE
jgi:hypothetical protein